MNVDKFSYLTFSLFFLILIASCVSHPSPPKLKREMVKERVVVSFPVVPQDDSETIDEEFCPACKEERIPHLYRVRAKKVFPAGSYRLSPQSPSSEESSETIEIGGKTYVVPPPWAGRKIAPPVFSLDSFAKIPVQYVHGAREVYVKKEVLEPLLSMLIAASFDGVVLKIESAYRDVKAQEKIFLRKFREGRDWEDVVRYVAPPGYSEHMLGLAIDFYPSGWKFASTDGYHWLKEYGKEYGFIESYPKYPRPGHMKMAWEAWHWCYVGAKAGEIPIEDMSASEVAQEDERKHLSDETQNNVEM